MSCCWNILCWSGQVIYMVSCSHSTGALPVWSVLLTPHYLIQCYCTLLLCKCFIYRFHLCVNSDLSIRIIALHVTHTHNAHRHWVEVEARFTGDLNHFASLIYRVRNPKRLAETLNARLESPKLFKWGAVEGSLCLGLFFTYWDNGIKCVTLEMFSCFTGLLKPTKSPASSWSEYRAAGLLVYGAELISGTLSLSQCCAWTRSVNDCSWTHSYFEQTWIERTYFCLMNNIVNAFTLVSVNGALSQFNFVQESARFS